MSHLRRSRELMSLTFDKNTKESKKIPRKIPRFLDSLEFKKSALYSIDINILILTHQYPRDLKISPLEDTTRSRFLLVELIGEMVRLGVLTPR